MPTVRTDLLAEGIRDLEVAPTGYFARNQVGRRRNSIAVPMRSTKFTFDGWDVTIQTKRERHIKATITGRGPSPTRTATLVKGSKIDVLHRDA